MDIVLFEDSLYRNLLPLVYFRPVWELRCGITTLHQKVSNLFPENKIYFTARDYLKNFYLNPQDIFSDRDGVDLLVLNGRILLQIQDRKMFLELPENSVLVNKDQVIAWRSKNRKLKDYFHEGILVSDRILNDMKTVPCDLTLITYPWDLIDRNAQNIQEDARASGLLGKTLGLIDKGAYLLGKGDIYLGANSRIMPGVVLDAQEGPVWIGENTRVMPNAVLQGPVALGRDCVIKIGAKIYHHTVAGPLCKLGGEIEATIIQGFTNKQHDGFLGHSYLGSWINIGADTNNSDLKNNYGEISVYLMNQTVDTGKRFLGMIMGDHTKTAINTMFNTGTVVGVNCNIYGDGFPPKFIPSFSWGGSGGLREYEFSKCIEVARVVMERRNVPFTPATNKLFEAVKELSLETENRVRVQK